MSIYMLNYDLRQTGQNYEQLIERLRQLKALRVLASTWLLKGSATAAQFRDDLMRFTDENDGVLVVGLDGNAAWSGRLFCTSEQLKSFIET